MGVIAVYLLAVFGAGLLARLLRLPPLIGFLAAGFALHQGGAPAIPHLETLSEIGVTLMLFAIGLRLDVRVLGRRDVWLTSIVHMVVMTAIGALFLAGLALVGVVGPTSWRTLATIGLLLSFSSTIVAVKVLQDRGDEQSLYGRICVGVLIMQDIAAVVVISASTGTLPSPWSVLLLVLVPLLAVATRRWHLLGHGEMSILFGLVMALVPGYALFSWLGLSGSLGALVMGLVLARHDGAEQLSDALFSVKELLLVGFFVSIGFAGTPGGHEIVLGLLLLLLLPLQSTAYWGLLWLGGLRNRTSVLTSLALANYSEFALIVASIGASAGWLDPSWVLALVIAVAGGFVVSALVNPQSVSSISALARRLPRRPPDRIHPDDRPIDVGGAQAIVLGMGRVGRETYAQLEREHGWSVLGVEHDPNRVGALRRDGLDVVEGDATDTDFWLRVGDAPSVEMIALAMPSQRANVEALHEMRTVVTREDITIVGIAKFQEDMEEMERLGLDEVVQLYAGAGESLADRAILAHERRGEAMPEVAR